MARARREVFFKILLEWGEYLHRNNRRKKKGWTEQEDSVDTEG